MKPRPRCLAPLLAAGCAGAAVWAAFPPVGAWWAAPLGLAVLASVLRARGPWAGAGLGLVFGLALFTPLLHFTAVAMGNPVGWAALTAVESFYLAAFGAAWALVGRIRRLERPGGAAVLARILAFTVLWCGVEEVRSSWPWGGFPFGRLAFATADAPMLPFAAYGGAAGLTALVACAGGALAETAHALRRRRGLDALLAASLAGLVVFAPVLAPVDGSAQDGTLRVGAVQGNVAEEFEDAFNRALEVTGNHAEATLVLADDVGWGTLDVVIWPENAADLDPRDFSASAALVDSAAQAVGAPVLVGAISYADNVRYNDMVVWSPGQGAGEYYRKHRPVPFAEYVPLREQLRHLSGQVDRIGTDLAPGTGPQTLTVHAAVQDRDVKLAMGICFEVAYEDTLRDGVEQGGELIVIPTNNASFLHSSEAEQQLAQGRVQAVIHGRALVQVSTVGVTAVINPRGVVEQRTQPYTQAALVADVPLRTSVTVADRLGALPGLALEGGAALLAVAGMVSGVSRPRRRRRLRRA
ncbi:apolipoprotein N-acyltransferase [Actinomyces ruminicola]|uniref:Apolipoprotein N-acyltransferase n=1 Tax=Actinomyces ruminicola TaxID=332524 RepID=A0A1G9UMN5_9ACTO|nr:apolipoprotein N-acyltransferase [Actinomyces ruminicola]SDM61178.1 apolipoprotein N-acyltransferase [Actinomyces ruminicola]